MLAFNPDFANFHLGIEVARAVHDGEVGEFAFFNRAELRGNAAELGGNRGKRGEGVGFGEAAVEGELQVFTEGFAVAEGVRGEGDFETLTAEERGIFRREIPGAKLVEGDVGPVVLVGKFWRGGEIHGDDAGERGGFGEVGATPFVAAGAEDGFEIELAREAGGAVEHEGAAGFEDDGERALEGRVEGLERGVEGGARARGIFRVVGVIEPVMLRVEQRLARDGDDAHERGGIGAFLAARGFKRDVLEDVGLEDDLVGIAFAEQHKGAGAADDSACGDDVASGETNFAKFLERFGIGRITVGDAGLRGDAGNFVTGAGRRAAFGGFDAEEINSARGGDGHGHRGAHGIRAARNREVGVDETRVNRGVGELPHARVSGDREVFGDGFEAAVANEDRRGGEGLRGAEDDLRADQRVDARGLGAVAGGQ